MRTGSAAHDNVLDDNPLWYDYVEPDEPPNRALLALAGLFSVTISVTTALTQLYRLPDRLWCRTARALTDL